MRWLRRFGVWGGCLRWGGCSGDGVREGEMGRRSVVLLVDLSFEHLGASVETVC